jgi:transcriptional antiterminator RfaH
MDRVLGQKCGDGLAPKQPATPQQAASLPQVPLDPAATGNTGRDSQGNAARDREREEREARRWRVLHVRAQQEKVLAKEMGVMSIEHFLPLNNETRRAGRKKVQVQTPVFPGYLFINSTLDEAYRVDRTKRVVNILNVVNQEQLAWELANLRKALQQKAPLRQHAFLKKGKRVSIRSGPFEGLEGVVEDRANSGRLILQVQVLGKATSLEIDMSLLDPLD